MRSLLLTMMLVFIVTPTGVTAEEDDDTEALEAFISFAIGASIGVCERYETCQAVMGALSVVIAITFIIGIIVGGIAWSDIFTRRNAQNTFFIFCGERMVSD